MAYSFHFFSSKCSLFHNSNVFASCIIHILYKGCAKIKKNNSGAKSLKQYFSIAGSRPGTGPWHQLYRAARGSPGICHFSFLSIFFFVNKYFIAEIFRGEKYSWMCRKNQTQTLAWGNYNMLQDFISPVFDN